MSAFSYWELCYATVEFSQKEFFFLPNSASLERFGNSFVSDVDIIAYNYENLKDF